MSVDASVVIPVGSVDSLLDEQLSALDGQTFTGRWELVLSLNSSDGDQLRRAKRLADATKNVEVVVVDSSEQPGASYARNVGVKAASSEVLIFCDADDIADPNWLAEIYQSLENNQVVGGHLEESLLGIPGQEKWRPPATPGALPKFLGHPYLVSANMGIRRDLFDRVGGFRTDLTRCEDIAFSWEILNLGVEMAYNRDAIIHYRHRKGIVPMLRQHYLYGIGFSEVLNRMGLPGQSQSSLGTTIRPNNQSVAKKSTVHYLRRGSIAAGRIAGIVKEKVNSS